MAPSDSFTTKDVITMVYDRLKDLSEVVSKMKESVEQMAMKQAVMETSSHTSPCEYTSKVEEEMKKEISKLEDSISALDSLINDFHGELIERTAVDIRSIVQSELEQQLSTRREWKIKIWSVVISAVAAVAATFGTLAAYFTYFKTP